MKRWARRGSILLGIIFLAASIYTVVGNLIMSRLAFPGASWWTIIFSRENVAMLIGTVYIVLLIIFMRTAKVKEAFAAIGG